jgi:hypothetical protein
MRNIKTIKRMIVASFLLVATGLSGFWTAEANPKPDVPDRYAIGIPVFPTEMAMKEWIRNRLGACQLVEFERDKRKVCVALESVGSGHLMTTIYIFINHAESGTWGIAAIWQTYTSEVKVVVPKKRGEVTFKTKSGKTLFRVPLETLESKDSPDY